MSADPAVTVDAPQTNESESQPEVNQLPAFSSEDLAALDAQLGIPAKLRTDFPQEQPKPETEEVTSETETPEAEAETATEDEPAKTEPETEDEEAETEEDEDEEDEHPQGKQPDVAKLQKRNYKLRLRARRAEDAAAEAQRKLDAIQNQQPVTVTPTIQDPLADVDSPKKLEARRQEFKVLRDYARANPDGWVTPDGKTEVDRDQAQQYLSYAEDVLAEHFPRKQAELQQIRPAARAQAEKWLPEMFVPGSKDAQAANFVWQRYPSIAASPERDALTALILGGWQKFHEEPAVVNGKNGNGKVDLHDKIPEKIRLAAEQRDKVPVLKHAPPGRTNVPAKTPEKANEEALEKLKRSGGSRDALIASLGDLPPLFANQRNRALSPV